MAHLTPRPRVLVLAHGLWYGGAQVSIVEFLRQMKDMADIQVTLCRGSNLEFVRDIEALGLSVSRVPYKLAYNYPNMEVQTIANLIRETDVVWMSDIEYVAAPKIKRIKNVPILAHLHSQALICPTWDLLYGLQGICTERCSPWKIIRCKQLHNEHMAKWNLVNHRRAEIYRLVDFIKGPLDFSRWPINRHIVDSIDRFIAVSNAVRDIHVAHMPCLRNRISVVYNPIPVLTSRFVSRSLRLTHNANVGIKLVYAGGGSIGKGPLVLLTALRKVLRERPEVRVFCAKCKGTFVEEHIDKSNLGKIILLDKLTHEEYHRLVSESHVVVVPSITFEAFPYVALESQYLGIPVVASDIGGIREIVQHGTTGILVRPFDHVELSEGIMHLIDNLENFDRSTIHRLTSEKFSNKLSSSKMMEALQSVSR
jgi:glycosyltransferase involved in cell wall biosynthesis